MIKGFDSHTGRLARRFPALVLGLALCAALPQAAKAVLVEGTFSGLITSSDDSAGLWAHYGLTGSLVGRTITGTIAYDTDDLPGLVSPNPDEVRFKDENEPMWLFVEVTVDGVLIPFAPPGGPYTGMDRDQGIILKQSGSGVDTLIYNRDDDLETVGGALYDYQVNVEVPIDLPPLSALPGDQPPTDIHLTFNPADLPTSEGFFQLIDSRFGNRAGVSGLEYKPTALDISVASGPPLPAPGALVLFGLGAGLVLVRRRRV
ncbi:MAG: PEP-CTERM sorting domain-containing protein [Rhodobacterales bacterium]|nr:PEP-CTERM sorting domain-containing protein [Rhodobacterales bacterium]